MRMMENYTKQEKSQMAVDPDSISWALLISNMCVILIGASLILRSFFDTSEGDFLDAGFEIMLKDANKEVNEHKESVEPMFITNPLFAHRNHNNETAEERKNQIEMMELNMNDRNRIEHERMEGRL